MITGVNASKTITKHTSYNYKCKFDGRKRNSDQWWNNDKCRYECKKRHVCEEDYIWKYYLLNKKFIRFTFLFINYTCIIDSC